MKKSKTFYIATSLSNVTTYQRVRDLLGTLGHKVTFDWSEIPALHPNDPRAKPDEGGELSDRDFLMEGRAMEEIRGVEKADAIIVILKGGIGTHTELGVALGYNAAKKGPYSDGIKIFIWAEGGLESKVEDGKYPCVFWYSPGIEVVDGKIEDLIVKFEAWAKS